MIYFLSTEAATLLGICLVLYLAWLGIKSMAKGLSTPPAKDGMITSQRKRRNEHPYLDLNIKPVSDGDEIRYAYKLDGCYVAYIQNKRKNAKLEITAKSEKELREKIKDTFRAWAVTGYKRRN